MSTDKLNVPDSSPFATSRFEGSEYMEAGISEYWLIDRFQRTMTVFRRPRKRVREIVITEDETYETPLLPGFELPLRKPLEVADLMEEATE